MDRKTDYAAQWFKYCALTNVIDSIIDIDLFEQQCVNIKELLQS